MKLGRCSFEGCNRRAKVKRECVLCEKKLKKHTEKYPTPAEAAPTAPEVHKILACHAHAGWSFDAMKTHVMRKHPVVLPSLVVAALKGEDVF